MSNSILYRMSSGIPGALTRTQEATVESGLYDSTKAFAAYGLAVVHGALKLRPPAAGDLEADIRGLLVRPYPLQTTQSEALGAATPPTVGIADFLTRGFMIAALNAGTAVKGASAYVRIASASAGKPIGGIEAAYENGSTAIAADAGNTGNATGAMNSTDTATGVIPGVYRIVNLTATTFAVFDPNGVEIGKGVFGTLFNGVIKFTITAGATPCVIGDAFSVTVTPNTILVPKLRFAGPADSNGFTEVAFNI